MSLAADTREAVRSRPFVFDALRAGLLNHSAAAAWLAEAAVLDGDPDAVAAALRRFREDLPAYATETRVASVSMRSGVGLSAADGAAEGDAGGPLLRVGDAALVPEGDRTAIVATGDVDAAALAATLRRLAVRDVEVAAAGVAGDALVCVVGRRDGPDAVRVVEESLDAVPTADPN
ncbi:hypothetical protein C464_02168 [Halorubrum coriense DSM 10284]|uniref:Uncharacterized protein n=1 Tax=Halorubrum coriense DSM 10284 TaxID=1227466 RepID=M0ESJ0_9EURY|nr:hypothetical protein [Halorubrum coriense]ELZ50660.1 hypothetical protein C464_02168 [Halorubrum coriense DSM 10284]